MKRRSIRYYACWLLFLFTLGGNGVAQADPGDGLRRLLEGLGETLGRVTGTYLEPTPGTSSFETAVEHKGLGRPVLYIRPEVVSPEKAPAVIMLSYSHTTPQTMANVVNAGELAAKYGVWVILPRAVLRHWQVSPWRIAPRDDVGFLAKVIRDATQRYPIDPSRVYMAGLSNGAYMITKFACAHPELLAGIATVGATIRKQQVEHCENSAPLPLFMVNGTRDTLSPYDGRFGVLSVEKTIAYWEKRNGCEDATRAQYRLPNTADDGMYTLLNEIQGCSTGADIHLLTVVGGGHSWPGADTFVTGSGLSSSTADFSATIKLWEFLRQFSRQQDGTIATDNNTTTVSNG